MPGLEFPSEELSPRAKWIHSVYSDDELDAGLYADVMGAIDKILLGISPNSDLQNEIAEDPNIRLKNLLLAKIAEKADKDSLTGDLLDLLERHAEYMSTQYGSPEEFRSRQLYGIWEIIETVVHDPKLLLGFMKSNISGDE
jgi:hypothetical protein